SSKPFPSPRLPALREHGNFVRRAGADDEERLSILPSKGNVRRLDRNGNRPEMLPLGTEHHDAVIRGNVQTAARVDRHPVSAAGFAGFCDLRKTPGVAEMPIGLHVKRHDAIAISAAQVQHLSVETQLDAVRLGRNLGYLQKL